MAKTENIMMISKKLIVGLTLTSRPCLSDSETFINLTSRPVAHAKQNIFEEKKTKESFLPIKNSSFATFCVRIGRLF